MRDVDAEEEVGESTGLAPSSAMREAAQGIENTARAFRLTDAVLAISTRSGYAAPSAMSFTAAMAAWASASSILTCGSHTRWINPAGWSPTALLPP